MPIFYARLWLIFIFWVKKKVDVKKEKMLNCDLIRLDLVKFAHFSMHSWENYQALSRKKKTFQCCENFFFVSLTTNFAWNYVLI